MKRLCLIAAPLLLAACVAKTGKLPVAPDLRTADVITTAGYNATIVAAGLNNPSSVCFRPGDGALTICDSANGRVIVIQDGRQTPIIEGMATEYWKKLEDGTDVFKVGPLTAAWLSPLQLAVTDAGKPDGEETVAVWHISSEGAAKSNVKKRSNTIPPTSSDEADKGEGNLSGMSLMPDGRTYYLCGHGSDAKSWVLRGDLETNKLETAFSADEHGITVNSPMQCIPWRGNLLVVYSGVGGEADGLIVEWDLETGKPANQWKTPGIVDPMGIAQVPGSSNRFAVTDNNWLLTGVLSGSVSLVTLGDADETHIERVASGVLGPVNCAFGPDDRLYVACLGKRYDDGQGLVIAINGFSDRK
jgi:WD40 repeat protein